MLSPELDRAQTELHRQQALFDTKAATHQQLEVATAHTDNSAAYLRRAKRILRAEGALATSQSQLEAAKRQQEKLNTKDDVYKADIEAKKADIVVARVNLSQAHLDTDGTDQFYESISVNWLSEEAYSATLQVKRFRP